MPEQRPYLSSDPNDGESDAPTYLSTDPNDGEPLRVNSRANTWSDRLGLNEGTASPAVGFLRGSGGAVVDMLQGAVAEVANQMHRKTRGEEEGVKAIQRRDMRPVDVSQESAMAAPQTTAGAIGAYLPAAAEMMTGPRAAAKTAIEAIPRVARAGEKFREVAAVANKIPIDTKAVGDVALRIQQLADRGGSMPMAVRKLLVRMTDPNKAAMTYEESRDFATNIGRLSVAERNRLTPVVRREVAALAAEINQANANAAKAAGKLAEYKSAMREYAQAMKLKEMAENAIKAAKKIAPWATAAGAAEYLTRDMRR